MNNPFDLLWKFLMYAAALAALYHLSEISSDVAEIRKACADCATAGR